MSNNINYYLQELLLIEKTHFEKNLGSFDLIKSSIKNENDEYDFKQIYIEEDNIFDNIFKITKDSDVSNLIISYLYYNEYENNFYDDIEYNLFNNLEKCDLGDIEEELSLNFPRLKYLEQ